MHDGKVAPVTLQTLARAMAILFVIVLTVFPFEFRPRIFRIELHGK